MKIQYAEPKIVRMDVNNDFLKKRIQPLGNLTVTPEALIYPTVDEKIPIMLRIRTTVMNKDIEVLGYTSEFKAVLSNIENGLDLKEISRFIQNAFLNYQVYFEQNAPNEIRHTRLDTNVPVNDLAQKFEDLILKK